MANKYPLSTEIKIMVNGSKLPEKVLAQVFEVTVDQHVHLPTMFTIRLYDPKLDILDGGPFDLTKKVEILAGDLVNNRFPLFKGEISALEPSFGAGMVAELLVRGYDRSHRLFRELKSRAFLNKKDSDLAEEIGQAAGLQVQVEATRIVYDHIFQHNQSDLAFLRQRALRIGYECFVAEGILYFRKPPQGGSALTLTWGDDLLTFHPRLSLAEQVQTVFVRGWDVDKQTPIVGQAEEGKLYPSIAEAQTGAEWGETFGKSSQVIVDQPVVSQSEADLLAAARLDERSGAFIQAQGSTYRRPDLKAGQFVKLESLGKRLSGKYLVTQATHVYSPDGFHTRFSVSGARTGLLAELVNGRSPQTQWPGAVTAVVTNTDDPKNWGRVKLKFPWMTEDAESDWARVAMPVAGPQAGFYNLPEVDDEVLVLFEHGDFSSPFVVGSLWNGQQSVPQVVEEAAQQERPLIRTWVSRKGHSITLRDDAKNKVELKTAVGHRVTLDDANNEIVIESNKGLTIRLEDNSGKISLESSGAMTLKSGSNLEIEAQGQIKISGSTLDLQANGPVNIKGAMVNLNS